MRRAPAWLKPWIPPALLRAARALAGDMLRLRGPYASWAQALAASSGYDDPAVLERVRDTARRVRRGEAAYERDGVTFATPHLPPAVAEALRLAAGLEHGRLRVLDYGGALGGLYNQCRPLLDALPDVAWRVVEQPHYVAAGRAEFADARLSFFAGIAEASANWTPNAVVLSSVLQYLEQPYAVVAELARLAPAVVFIDRTPFTAGAPDVLAVQEVPAALGRASYPSWVFDERRLREAFAGYDVLAARDSPEGEVRGAGIVARYRGLTLRRRDARAGAGA
jgi:putative methyltransferase (TIGR04325 family)